jgi:HTH-type transcriptional regulator / antitoxin HigA
MNIKPIKTEADYKDALKKMELIFHAAFETPESDEVDIPGLMIDEYERKNYPIDAPDPTDRSF